MTVKTKEEFLNENTCQKCDGEGNLISGNTIAKCKCLADWELSYRIFLKCTKAGLNKKDLDYDISTYFGDQSVPDACIAFVDAFKTSFRETNIYFYGKVNTQKSTMARYIARELTKKSLICKYVLMDDLIKTLVKAADHNAEIKDAAVSRIDDFANADLLILDESFDSERITVYKSNYQLPFLTTFLKSRLEVTKKSTIFISNIAPTGIQSEGFTEALQSLILRESMKLEFKDSLDKKHAMKSTDFLDLFK